MSEETSNRKLSSRKPKRKNGEGSIYWDKHLNKYVAAVIDINGKRQRARFDNEDDAQAWRQKQKEARQKGEGTFVRNPKATLADYLNDWLNTKNDLTPNGYRNYEQTIRNRINPQIGHIKVSKLSPRLLENYLQNLTLEQKYKGGTVRGVIRTLNSAFNDGVRWGELPFNPMKKVKNPKVISTPSPRIPREDAERLRAMAAKNPFDKARLEVGMSIGLRPGEVAGLKWKDFNPWDATLTIERQIQRIKGKGLVECPPKTLRKKPVPLLWEQVVILTELQISQYGDIDKGEIAEKYIFPNSVGKPMDSVCDRKWFRRLCEKSGVARYERYQMRKTAFTDLSYHARLATVKEYSGHTQISTLLNHYIDPDESAVRDALERSHRAIHGPVMETESGL